LVQKYKDPAAQVNLVEVVREGSPTIIETMRALLNELPDVKVTEEVVEAAAGNWDSDKEVMALLLDRRGDQVTITDEAVSP
jgi:hypothetical protein